MVRDNKSKGYFFIAVVSIGLSLTLYSLLLNTGFIN